MKVNQNSFYWNITVIGMKDSDDDIQLNEIPFLCEEDRDDPSLYRMGVGDWRPNWLQQLNSLKCFMLILTILSLTHGIVVTGLTKVSIDSIENEFGLSSEISAAILVGSDAGALLVVTLVSFFGSNGSKPKWMATGAFLSGIGSLLFSLPKLMIGRYEADNRQQFSSNLCFEKATVQDNVFNCNKHSYQLRHSLILIFAQMLMGIGGTPLQTLAPTYIDENSSPCASPIYLGVWLASLIMGPILGITVGTAFLKTFTDVGVTNRRTIADATNWVGAWWRGYLFVSVVFIFLGAFILLFPQKMKGGRLKREAARQKGELPQSEGNNIYNCKMFLDECVRMCHNYVFVLAVVAMTVNLVYQTGLFKLTEKILHHKFDIPEVKVTLMITVIMLLAVSGGILAGAHVMRRLKTGIAAKTGAKICAVISFLVLLHSFIFKIPGCENTKLAGIVVPYPNSSRLDSIRSGCNAECGCSVREYQPVCASTGLTYHSPCFAGCKVMVKLSNETVALANCSCIPDQFDGNYLQGVRTSVPDELKEKRNISFEKIMHQATLGKCDRACQHVYLFITVLVIGTIIASLIGIPHFVMILRSVPDNKRSLALGLQYLIMRSVNFLPGPMFIDSATDGECITWSYDNCGLKKDCLDYNLDNLSDKVIMIGATTSAIATILYILSWWLYPATRSDDRRVLINDVG